ncbi:MAG: hypothetical protein ACI814_003983, partial [Mariniblastus sp.]
SRDSKWLSSIASKLGKILSKRQARLIVFRQRNHFFSFSLAET